MSNNKIRDNHTLYLRCDCATVAQITASITSAISTYQKTHGVNLDCRFKVSLVENRDGKSHGIAFVFVTNPAVYNMLIGRNSDGSSRIEYRDDPSWSAPAIDETSNDSGWSGISSPIQASTNWCDMVEEEAREERLREARAIPQIAVTLDPLMTLPPYTLTEEQVAQKREQIIAANEGKEDFDPAFVCVPREAYFSVDSAVCYPVDNKYMSHILKCKDVPLWATKEDLKTQFAPFASDHTTKHERMIKGRRIEETYPFVNINDDRVAFIIFDQATHDAQFALHMMKKTVLKKTMKNGVVEQATLMFGHSFRTDRDTMASISQKPHIIASKSSQPPRARSMGKVMPIQRPKQSVAVKQENSFYVLNDS